MEIKGRVLQVMPERSGVSKRTGLPWKSVSFILEFYENPTDRQADRVVLDARTDKDIELVRICAEHSGEPGYEVKCVIGHWVNEWNGNHYNDIRVYSIEAVGNIPISVKPAENEPAQGITEEQKAAMEKLGQIGEQNNGENGSGDNLPF